MKTITSQIILGMFLLTFQARADEASPFGINTHMPNAQELDLVAAAGIDWIRVDFNWFQLEPSRDSYSWSTTDSLVNAASARGLEIFATLAYTPDWANDGAGISAPPIDYEDWVDFVSDVVSRYRGSISHWGIWNEPNLEQFFSGTRDQYIFDILIPGADAVRAVDPMAMVLAPELAHLDSGEWETWLNNVLQQAGDWIDIVTHHNYSDNGTKVLWEMGAGKTALVRPRTPRGIMQSTGYGNLPLWLTETGWHTDEVSQEQQADYYEQTLDGVLNQEFLDKVFFYELKDDPNIDDKWGILTSDLVAKESYDRYQSYIASHRFTDRNSCPR